MIWYFPVIIKHLSTIHPQPTIEAIEPSTHPDSFRVFNFAKLLGSTRADKQAAPRSSRGNSNRYG